MIISNKFYEITVPDIYMKNKIIYLRTNGELELDRENLKLLMRCLEQDYDYLYGL